MLKLKRRPRKPAVVHIAPEDVPPPITAPTPEERPIDQLALTSRTRTALTKAGVELIAQLKEYETPSMIPGIGPKASEEILAAIASFEVPPDQIPLSFTGLIFVFDASIKVRAPSGWKYVDLDEAYGPCRSAAQLQERLRALVQYHKIMVRLDPSQLEEPERFARFLDYNKIPCVGAIPC